ncbi:hypothetical protein CDL12_09133 [Handroanthus impetiginosus]|uniref:Putative plant transposon protein domain-containing protein n=1 Tax=Handroanthus impetiginosus TaxID=429701 RepID=A0A2G9HL94_9LAMI|nr:hypothetical protein CDL12_09133 [Handroanthus impetiginosus]
MVQGETINFLTSAIKHFFHTPIIHGPNEFNEFAREPSSLEIISECICTSRPDWIRNVYNELTGIPRSFFTNEAWDWMRFINARLFPSSHTSEINKDRTILLYAILTDVPLDIGSYIHNVIWKSVWGGLTINLYFSNLITALCQQEGIRNLPGDELI